MSSISSAVGSMARSAPTCSASRGLSEMEGSSIRSRICASLSRRRARAISMLFARFRSISRMRAELGGSEARGESARSDVARLRRGLSCSGGSANMASSLTKSSSASDSESDELCSLSELPESSRLKSIDLPLSPLTDPRRFDFGLRRTFFAACTGSDQSVLPTIEAGSFVQWSGRMGTVGSGCGEQEGEACSDAPMLEAWDSNVGGGGGGGGTGEPGSRGEFSGGGSSGGGGGGGGPAAPWARGGGESGLGGGVICWGGDAAESLPVPGDMWRRWSRSGGIVGGVIGDGVWATAGGSWRRGTMRATTNTSPFSLPLTSSSTWCEPLG
mmetsp:Transcript_36982/g.90179  ORF Transcript_36982/g.90179 Transcript_36982/m.90179 type:complete len:328 (+) Transcript_36982:1244-2227(+)